MSQNKLENSNFNHYLQANWVGESVVRLRQEILRKVADLTAFVSVEGPDGSTLAKALTDVPLTLPGGTFYLSSPGWVSFVVNSRARLLCPENLELLPLEELKKIDEALTWMLTESSDEPLLTAPLSEAQIREKYPEATFHYTSPSLILPRRLILADGLTADGGGSFGFVVQKVLVQPVSVKRDGDLWAQETTEVHLTDRNGNSFVLPYGSFVAVVNRP